METLLKDLAESLIEGNAQGAADSTSKLLESGVNPKQVLDEGLISGMNVVAERFKSGEYFVPEVLVAARAMKGAMELLREALVAADIKPLGTVVIGTVEGDMHDIGKNLVVMFLEGAGFRVMDLGVNVSPAGFVAAAREHSAGFVGLSALLTTTMPTMRRIIQALEEANLREQLKVIIGGAPVTGSWAHEIGADGFAEDAATAVDLCKDLMA